MMQLRALVRTAATRRMARRTAAPHLTHTYAHIHIHAATPSGRPRWPTTQSQHAAAHQARAYTSASPPPAAPPPHVPSDGMRQQALDTLAASATSGDILSTYRVAHAMRATNLLRDTQGQPTAHALLDASVAAQLTQAIAGHHTWEQSASLVDMLVEMRAVGQGRQPMDPRFVRTGRAVDGADPRVVERLAHAVLAPQYAGLPDRRLAGLTAKQLLADYRVPPEAYRLLAIRAEGYASRGRALHRLLHTLGALTPAERFEAALAHARCLDAAAAETLLGALQLSPEQRREAHEALALCAAENGDLARALRLAEHVPDEPSLRVRLWIARAAAMSVVPRRPFSEPFHTLLSAHRSRLFDAAYAGHVAAAFDAAVKAVHGAEEHVRGRLDALVFSAECAVHAMRRSTRVPGTPETPETAETPTWLEQRLAAMQDALAAQMAARGVTRDSPCAAPLAHAFGSPPLRQFLWAQQFDATLTQHPRRKRWLMLSWLNRTCATLPCYILSAPDLTPALVSCLPPTVWTQEPVGGQRADAAFEAADGFLLAFERQQPADAPTLDVQRKALGVLRDGRLGQAGHAAVHVLLVWLHAARRNTHETLVHARRALRAASVALEPGALALRHVHGERFFATLLPALAMTRPAADFALSHVLPLLPRTLSPRLACAVLRCCATARNASVALDAVSRLPEAAAVASSAASPKVRELLLRALLRGGRPAAALQELRELTYALPGASPSDTTFALVVAHTAHTSLRAAEHAFDAWLHVAAHHGRVGRALLAQYDAVGLTHDARTTLRQSSFAPPHGRLPSEALSALGTPPAEPQSRASGFLRTSELHVLTALLRGYAAAGLLDRSRMWESWLIKALASGALRVRPELVACLALVQRAHLVRRSVEHVRACLDLIVAVDRAAAGGLMTRPMLRLNQLPVFRMLTYLAYKDKLLRNDMRGYLADAQAAHLWAHILPERPD